MEQPNINQIRKTFPTKQQVMEQTPDPGVRMMLEHLAEKNIETAFDRFDAQKPQCTFGMIGTCCRICHMGPCRITEKTPRGVCGADAHVVVARNILRWVAAGTSSHGSRSREVILALKKAGAGELDVPIRGVAKVQAVAKALGIDTNGKSINQLAEAVADALLSDMSRTIPGPHQTIHAMAPGERIKVWTELDIMPISSYHEVFESLHRTSTGTDGDWESLMKQFLRCGLAFAWNSVVGATTAADCLYGLPQRSTISTNFGSLEENYVNIAIHGHSPVLPAAIVKAAADPELVELAKSVGAVGIRLYGICCSGLSALYRFGDVHPLSNALGAELVMGTGALDAWVVDVQDVYPSLTQVAECFHTKIITTNDSCHLPGAIHLGFDHHHSNMAEAGSLAKQIIQLGIDNYPLRKQENIFIPQTTIDAEIGFSVENIGETFQGLESLLECIKDGTIKGIVNLVGCNNPKLVYEQAITQVADVLLANDVIVLTNGCASFPLLKLGYCNQSVYDKLGPGLKKIVDSKNIPPVWHMGECLDNARASALFRGLSDKADQPIKYMPFAFSSPEWSNEKGVCAALSFRLMGVNSYHCIHAPIIGSAKVNDFFTKDTFDMLGSVAVTIPDPQKLGEKIVADMIERRKALGWS
ncbi:carbon-monoxide dehydrogenase catalytic subunit [Sporomusaceae bacterium FL31]|nr:carbon-monoxide dehydrogenase catalytic subunit [Sporomusaceae bacterium FL31]GCE33549.1 carbon-monoxide dehydrogenase catalytic subunit [Sporomusaceae bacterium]